MHVKLKWTYAGVVYHRPVRDKNLLYQTGPCCLGRVNRPAGRPVAVRAAGAAEKPIGTEAEWKRSRW
jgi:hypothetical protein